MSSEGLSWDALNTRILCTRTVLHNRTVTWIVSVEAFGMDLVDHVDYKYKDCAYIYAAAEWLPTVFLPFLR